MKMQCKITKTDEKYFGYYFKGFNKIEVELKIPPHYIQRLNAQGFENNYLLAGSIIADKFIVTYFKGCIPKKK